VNLESANRQVLNIDRYITEISPPRSRGTLASIPQLLTTAGLCAGYFICYGSVSLASSASWRIPLVLQAGIAYVFTVCVLLFLPESPRWLAAVGRHPEAIISWEKLGIDAAEREKIEDREGGDLPQGVKMKDILAVFGKDAWRRTGLGVFMMGMQQASGIDGVLYYAPLLFASAGLSSSTSAFLASGISALLIFLITIPGTIYADKWGRTTSTITGGIIQALCMFTIGSLYAAGAVHASHGTARWVVVALIYVFALAFSGTWGVTFRVYVSEIQSPKTRAGSTSLSLSANWTVNWIIAFTTPIFLAHSTYGVYFLFGGATILTVFVCVCFMPETRGRSLEDIDASFGRWGKKTGDMELRGEETLFSRQLDLEFGDGERNRDGAQGGRSKGKDIRD
jgi:sugar porter (SP) family MFS transporter